MSVLKPIIVSQVRKLSSSGVSRGICSPLYGPLDLQQSVLMNGIKVAALKPLGAQISACTIMFQVGSRHEIDSRLGATHFLRSISSGTGCGHSGYSKTRVLQQYGASLTCTSDRQRVAYTLRCPRPVFKTLSSYLLDTATRYQHCKHYVVARSCFVPWELDDRKDNIQKDLIRLRPEARVLDMIQTASFTGPLSNSIYCLEDRVAGMSQSDLTGFVGDYYLSSVCTVASYGLPFEETLDLAEKVQSSREVPIPCCEIISKPRGGFELHDLGSGSDTWIAIAVPGTGTSDQTSLLQHSILAAAAGNGNLQGGQHFQDRRPMAPLGALAGFDIYTSYRAFNISYKETGLFGILVKTKAKTAWDAAVSAAKFLTKIECLSCCQLDLGKTRLKLAMTLHYEDPVRITEGLALSLFNSEELGDACFMNSLIDCICPNELAATAQQISSKCKLLSLAVVGDIGAVPSDAELVCGSLCDTCE